MLNPETLGNRTVMISLEQIQERMSIGVVCSNLLRTVFTDQVLTCGRSMA